MPHRVVVLVRDGVMPLELGIVHQIFGAAVAADGRPLYEVRTCALTVGEVRTHADFPITVAHGPDALEHADTVIVLASHAPDAVDSGGELTSSLREALGRIRPGARIASICTGAFVLAAAGLLDGKCATTHWKSTAEFRSRFPSVDLRPDVLYTDDDQVLTAAGEASGIDLCLHLVRRDFGAAVANAVARTTVVPPHRPGGQAQYIRQPVTMSTTTRARNWALENLDRPLSLRELAACESVSVRTFTRRFRTEVGLSPGEWLTAQRLERVKQLLEETDLPVEQIAGEAGFGTAASLRQHLHAAIGVSPRSYRATFRGQEPSVVQHGEQGPQGARWNARERPGR